MSKSAYGMHQDSYARAIAAFVNRNDSNTQFLQNSHKLEFTDRGRFLIRTHMSDSYGIEMTISTAGLFDVYKISDDEKFLMFKLEWG